MPQGTEFPAPRGPENQVTWGGEKRRVRTSPTQESGAERGGVVWDIWPLLLPGPDPLMAAAVRPLVSIEPQGAGLCALSLTAGGHTGGGRGTSNSRPINPVESAQLKLSSSSSFPRPRLCVPPVLQSWPHLLTCHKTLPSTASQQSQLCQILVPTNDGYLGARGWASPGPAIAPDKGSGHLMHT